MLSITCSPLCPRILCRHTPLKWMALHVHHVHHSLKVCAEKCWPQGPEKRNATTSGQEALVLLRGLGRRDGPNEDTKHRLGDDVCNRVADLLVSGGYGTCEANHLDHVHAGIREPRDGSQVPRRDDETPR